jgi:flagellar biogenesis protein FliO
MELLQQVSAVVFVLALLWLLVWKLGRFQSNLPGNTEKLRCTERLRLTAGHSLHVVVRGERSWLLACHPGGVQPVAELDASIPSAAAAAGGAE